MGDKTSTCCRILGDRKETSLTNDRDSCRPHSSPPHKLEEDFAGMILEPELHTRHPPFPQIEIKSRPILEEWGTARQEQDSPTLKFQSLASSVACGPRRLGRVGGVI